MSVDRMQASDMNQRAQLRLMLSMLKQQGGSGGGVGSRRPSVASTTSSQGGGGGRPGQQPLAAASRTRQPTQTRRVAPLPRQRNHSVSRGRPDVQRAKRNVPVSSRRVAAEARRPAPSQPSPTRIVKGDLTTSNPHQPPPSSSALDLHPHLQVQMDTLKTDVVNSIKTVITAFDAKVNQIYSDLSAKIIASTATAQTTTAELPAYVETKLKALHELFQTQLDTYRQQGQDQCNERANLQREELARALLSTQETWQAQLPSVVQTAVQSLQDSLRQEVQQQLNLSVNALKVILQTELQQQWNAAKVSA